MPIEIKKGIKEVSDFRHISMTNNFNKVLEQVLIINLEMEEDHIPTHQFGFQSGHLTIDALCLLRTK